MGLKISRSYVAPRKVIRRSLYKSFIIDRDFRWAYILKWAKQHPYLQAVGKDYRKDLMLLKKPNNIIEKQKDFINYHSRYSLYLSLRRYVIDYDKGYYFLTYNYNRIDRHHNQK